MAEDRQFVLIPVTSGYGYQVAEVLPNAPANRLRIRRWESRRKVWMLPSTIAPDRVIGGVPSGDRRLVDIEAVEKAQALTGALPPRRL